LGHPRELGQDGVFDHESSMHRIDAGARVPVGLQRLGIRKKVGVVGFDCFPAISRRTRAPDARIALETGGQFA
jgi:hypothetical protein